jgi:hypothetical protein
MMLPGATQEPFARQTSPPAPSSVPPFVRATPRPASPSAAGSGTSALRHHLPSTRRAVAGDVLPAHPNCPLCWDSTRPLRDRPPPSSFARSSAKFTHTGARSTPPAVCAHAPYRRWLHAAVCSALFCSRKRLGAPEVGGCTFLHADARRGHFLLGSSSGAQLAADAGRTTGDHRLVTAP